MNLLRGLSSPIPVHGDFFFSLNFFQFLHLDLRPCNDRRRRTSGQSHSGSPLTLEFEWPALLPTHSAHLPRGSLISFFLPTADLSEAESEDAFPTARELGQNRRALAMRARQLPRSDELR